MKPTIENLQDAFRVSSDVYESSDTEAQEVIDLYHNRQYTQEEIDTLLERGQPVETFNIVKSFGNAMLGYLDTVVNNVIVKPRYAGSPTVALLLDDTLQYILDINEFEEESKKIALDGILTGKMCLEYEVEETGAKDDYGRKIRHVNLKHLPAMQVRIDPMARKEDGSDSRFTSYYQWVDEEEAIATWGAAKVKKLEEYSTDGTQDAMFTNFEHVYGKRFVGRYKEWNNYLIIKTVMVDGDKTWATIWSGDTILEKTQIPFKKVRRPIRVVQLSRSDRAEHYGMFHDVIETQRAINQALIQIQMLVNTSKAFIQDDAIGSDAEDLRTFKEQFNAVNEVVVVKDLQGVQIEDMSKDIKEQYNIIAQALDRVKTVLGVNDSFLGSTFASDSARKVNLQQNSSKSQLSPVVDKIKFLYKMVGTDLVHFVQQYYVASQVLRIADKVNGDRYIKLNEAIQMPTGELDVYGQPITNPVMAEEIDPVTGEPMQDEYGNYIVTPLNEPESDIKFLQVDIKVESVPYNNSAEQNQLLFETFLQGPVGQSILQTNPGMYYSIAAMQVSEYGTKNSMEISMMLHQLAQQVSQGQLDPSLAMAGGDMQAIMGAANGGSTGNPQNGPSSQALQIPTGGK